jgi:hypothetical protein
MQIDFEDRSYGYALIARVQRVGSEWRAVIVRHMEG